MAANVVRAAAITPLPLPNVFQNKRQRNRIFLGSSQSNGRNRRFPSFSLRKGTSFVLACLPRPPASQSPTSSPHSSSAPSTKLYVSGLSFRATEESLRNAFKNFGQLVEVNLVMDKIANRPRGFAFLRYATEEDSQKAIEGMHGKDTDKKGLQVQFLDGRVIFVEVAKPRSELRQRHKENPR